MDTNDGAQAPETGSTLAAPPKKAELRNSMWCLDPSGRLGMIAEINGGTAMFYREKTEGGLEASPTYVPLEKLKLCAASQVPARCGFTAEQLADYGYE